jgi:hypothetical protein
MGNNSSNQSSNSQQKLIDEATRKFNIRVKSYSFPHHGPYYEYIEWCRAQYELDCIPQYCRQGSNYNPNNHNHY